MAGGAELGAVTSALRQQAYARADVDTVARIRALADDGAGCSAKRRLASFQALVCFSCGQDRPPACRGAAALPHVETIGFDYGQRQAARWSSSPSAAHSPIVPRTIETPLMWIGQAADVESCA